jgi:hypothetical protein
MERKLILPIIAGLVFAAVVTGFTLIKSNIKTETKNVSKSLVFQRQLIGHNQFVGEIEGVMKTALATEKDGGRVTVSRGKSRLEFAIPINDPTLNSLDVGILQATDVSFASKDKIISAKYNLVPDGIKEEIIMNKIPQENTLPLIMKTENLNIKLNPDGIPVFYDPSGDYQFHFERPYVKDGTGQVSYGVKYQFINQNNDRLELFKNIDGKDTQQKLLGDNIVLPAGQYTLLIEIDSDWLHDPKRVLPIIVDPTVVHNTTAEFTAGEFNRSFPDTSQGVGAPVTELTGDANTIGLYHFDETADDSCSGGEDACDSSGNNNHGSANGTTIITYNQALGAAARTYSGSSQDVALANESSFDFERTSPFSIEAWVKTTSTSEQKIVSKLDSSAPNSGYEFWMVGGTGQLSFYLINSWSGNAIQVVGTNPINDGQWHHVAVTYSGSSTAAGVKLYLDGVEEATTVPYNNLTASILNNISVYVGSRNHNSFYFNGAIDEVMITDDVRSGAEITTDAARGPAIASYYQETPASKNTSVLWHMDEASGNLLDASGNGNTGTVTGTTVVDGKLGDARSFNGTTDKVNVTADLGTPNEMSISFWFNKSNTNAGTQYFADGRNGGNWWLIQDYEGGTLCITDTGGNICFDDRCMIPSNMLKNDTWHHVSITEDVNSCNIYLDGEFVSRGAGEAPTIGANMRVATRFTDTGFYSGMLDEFSISNIMLSPEDIKAAASRRPYSTFMSDVIDATKVYSWNSLSWTELGVTTGDGETIKDSTGLVAQWNLNETSGTTATNNAGSCSTSCDGTLTSFASTASQDQAAGTGWTADNRRWGAGALMFDGTDDNVSAGTVSDLEFTGDFSLETWVKPSGGTVGQIVSSGTNSDWLYLLGGSTANSPICKIYQANSGSGYLQVDGKKPITDGMWHQVVCTLSGTTLSLYIDGVLNGSSSSVTGTRDVSTAGTFTIGKFTNASSTYFNGVIDSFRAYSRPLTAAEVLSNYNSSNLEMQTRVGDTANPDDGSWEEWRPTTSETQIDDFDSNTDSDGIDTVYLGDVGTNQTWIKKNNTSPSASDTTSTDGRIPLGTTGKGDDLHSYFPWVIKDGSTYKMWYGGHDGTNVRTYYTTSSDGLTWTKYDNTIEAASDTTGTNGRIPLGTAGKGDSTHAFYPSVIKDGSTYKMWYAGNDGTNYRIYYATSSDGLSWTKYDNTIPAASDTSSTNGRIPLGTAGKGDVSIVQSPSVIKDGSTYKMWYTGSDGTNSRIFYATSPDGLTWTKYDNTIPAATDNVSTNGRLGLGSTGADTSHAYIPRVIKDGDVYKMWYGMHNGNVREGYAISRDGLTWAKYNNAVPAVSDTTGTFGRVPLGNTGRGDQTHAFGGTVIKDDGVYKMWYQGHNGTNYAIYYTSMAPLPLKQELDTNIKMEGTASEKITTGISKIDAGTIALWHLDETGGTGAYIKDSSGNAYDGTPTGTTVVDGISNKGRDFNGSSDYILTPSFGFDYDNLTIEAWVKVDSLAARRTIIDLGTETTLVPQLEIGTCNAKTNAVCVITPGVWQAETANNVVTAGQWIHVAYTKSDVGATHTIYVNGIAQTLVTNASADYATTAAVKSIGKRSAASQLFPGIIDEIRISNVARTAEEISEAYRLGRGHYINRTISSTDLSSKSTLPFYIAADRPGTYLQATVGESYYANYQADTDTLGLWHMEEQSGSGEYIIDSSVSGVNGTPTGTTSGQGIIGRARIFNGTTDFISMGDVTNFDGATALTLQAWINPDTLPDAATYNSIVAKADFAAAGNAFAIRLNGTEGIRFLIRDSGGTQINCDTGVLPPTNAWTLITAVLTSSDSCYVYYNGILKVTSTNTAFTSIQNTATLLKIGSSDFATEGFFDGTIDEVMISNTARTIDEIRQSYEAGLRSHPITIDFAASLDSGNLIASSGDTSFTVDATSYGLSNKGSKVFSGDKIIVRENYDGTEYIAQGTVSSVNESTGAVTVASWDSGSTFPSGGYTVNASVFKWQREYWNIAGGVLDSHLNATTNLTLRLLEGNEGRTIWIDDLSSGGDYLTTPAGSTITSSTYKRYFQYRTIEHSSNENVSASLTSVTLDYVQNSPPNTPTLDAPTDTQTNTTLTPVMQTTTTDTNSDNIQYKIELCENLAMTTNCQTFDQNSSQTGWSGQNADGNTTYTSGTQGTYTVQTPLTAGTTYYWRSYAIDPFGVNQWSSTQGTPYSFTTSTAPSSPSTPYAEGATNPTGVADTAPEFSAIHSDPDSDAANYYQIQVNTQSDFLGTSMWDSTKQSMTTTANGVRSPDISYSGTAIPLDGAGTTYYWRIKFWDTNGAEGSYTTAQSFTMNVKPGTPTLDSPTDTAVNQSVLASLKTTSTDGDGNNLKYKIELCTNVGMTSDCQTFDQTLSQTGWSGQNADTNTTYTSGTQATYNIQSALSPAATFYWRSYSIDPSGSNTWSSTQGAPYSFTTTSTDYPTTCRIEKSINNDSLVIKWNDNSTNEINYEIQKNTDSGGFSLLQTLAANTNSHQDTAVSNGHTYQYRVAAIFTGSIYSEWCTTSTLTLGLGNLHMQGINLE